MGGGSPSTLYYSGMPARSTRVAIYVRMSKEEQDPEYRGRWRLGPAHGEETRVS
jgi:hypothetical protein